MGADGYVIIGTELDTKDLERELNKSLTELKRYEKEAEKLTQQKAKIEIDLTKYEEEKQKIQQSTDERLKFAQTEEQVNWVLDEEKMELEQLNQQYSKQFSDIENINNKLQDNANKQKLIKQQVQETNAKLRETKSLDSIKNSIDGIGNSMKGVINKTIRWGLAIFGIRSAYMLIRQSMSTLSQYDEKLATDIEYIRYAIAMTLKPVIEKIIQLVYKLLYYVGYLAKAWFGIDIFANASANAFQKAKNNLKGATQQAKELRKQLAGFDEMNILNDNVKGAGTSDQDKFTMPSYDLKDFKVEPSPLLEWLAKNGDLIKAILLGIAGALLALKLGLDGIKALGIGIAIAGIVYAIQGLLKYLKSPTWENFGQIIQGLGIAVIGLGVAFLGLPGIIVGVAILIFGTIVKYWGQIKEFIQTDIIDWLTDKSDWIHEHFGDFIGDIYDTLIGKLQTILNKIDGFMNDFKGYFDDLIAFINNIFAGNWASAWENIKDIFMNRMSDVMKIVDYFMHPGTGIFSLFGFGGISIPIPFVKGKKSAKGSIIYPSKLPKLAMGGIINQPGKGVPYNGAIIGERGAEAVLPLTDSGQMALLGEAIGKYVNINATIPVYVGNRQVARTIRKIDAEDDFAFNK